jgi:hypothetical protein
MAGLVAILGLGWALNKYSEIKQTSNRIQLAPLEITQKIFNEEIPILNHLNYKEEQRLPKSEQLVDHLREYKDISTDFIVKHFLSTDNSMFNFLQLVYSMFYSCIEEFKRLHNLEKWDVFFVYKGGNVLRIISNDFLRELPHIASYKINEYYESFFKRSDADFSIYIKPTLDNYDLIYSQLTTLSYYLQVKIREEFYQHPTKYFEFYKYNKEYQTSILKEYYQKIKDSKAIRDMNNTIFYNRSFDGIVLGEVSYPEKLIRHSNYIGHKDIGLQMDNNDIVMYELEGQKSSLFIQANETLDFLAANARTKFNLVRTKLDINYVFDGKTVEIGGELIDVSIPHRLDNNVGHFFEHTDYVEKYQLSKGKNDVLTFYSYSLQYLVEDLEYILFRFVNLPWLTPKYEKRLNRLFYLYFIDLFIELKNNLERKEVIVTLQKICEMKLNTKKDVLEHIRIIEKSKLQDGLKVNHLLKELVRICKLLKDSEQIEEYNKMLAVLAENCKFVSTAFDGIKDYCSTEGNISMKVLYENDFSSLI